MGIGEAIAKIFVDHNATVALLSRDAGRAEAARARIGRETGDTRSIRHGDAAAGDAGHEAIDGRRGRGNLSTRSNI